MLLPSWLSFLGPACSRVTAKRRRGRQRAARQLRFDTLEDRLCPSGGYLLAPDYDKNNVLRYDEATGAFVDEFVSRQSGGLNQPWIALIGPHDGNLYVSTGHFRGPGQIKAVLRYDGTTGAFLDEFVQRGQMDMTHAVMFGPDGNLYVGVRDEGNTGHPQGGRIARFDGITGAFMDDFVPLRSGGLLHPLAHVFGPSGRGPRNLDLYVTDEDGHDIKRYDGTTGAFLGVFVAAGSGVISDPLGLTFGPDGNLYVADLGIGAILRFQGPSGKTPGAPMPSAGNSGAVFVAPGSGGLLARPLGVIFGPDGNGDGRQDVYVSNITFTGFYGKDGNVKRYDGLTGAFIDTFVPTGSGGLDDPSLITFTETDPVTLAYSGGRLTASAIARDPVSENLGTALVQPLLTEALARWQGDDLDTFRLSTVEVRIADLPGATLGEAVGHTIYLDVNAAGWGWFVDSTPWDDSEFTTPGDQGEQGKIDLLTVLAHEIGHLLGQDHDEDGVMAETLTAGTRLRPMAHSVFDWFAASEAMALAEPSLSKRRR